MLRAGLRLAGDTPVLVVNEPMFISQGQNSDIRYNFFYPRWAYDSYRDLMAQTAAREGARQGWRYLDLWDAIPAAEFTNTAIHMTPNGSKVFAGLLAQAILETQAAARTP